MGATDAYLLFYNAACMAGWGAALFLAVQSLLSTQGDLTAVWAAAGVPLQVAQYAMMLEIAHAALRLVRSPVFQVFVQVGSRVVVAVTLALAPSMTATTPCGVLAVSWSLIEVVRYAFYLNALLVPGQTGTVFPIFWLRYSLFAILYPSGIYGEVLVMLGALADPTFTAALGGVPALLVKLVLYVLYPPGCPFMYVNMVVNRKKAFKKRFAPPPPPPKAPVGAEFPEDSKGGRSTSETGKKVIAAALAGAGTPEGAEASTKCAKERNWRFGYNKHIAKLARVGCKSAEAAKGTAEAGLKWMHEHMIFHSADQKLAGAFGPTVDKVKASFETGTVKGTRPAKQAYTVPYDGGWHPSRPRAPPEDSALSGEALKAQARPPATLPSTCRSSRPAVPPWPPLPSSAPRPSTPQAAKWASTGMIEPDAAAALCWTSDYFASGKGMSDVYVVMIGAGSAMGPLPKLLEMGATVVAIDIPGSWGKGGKRPAASLWKRLCDTARDSPGALVFPLSKPQKECADDEDMYESSGCARAPRGLPLAAPGPPRALARRRPDEAARRDRQLAGEVAGQPARVGQGDDRQLHLPGRGPSREARALRRLLHQPAAPSATEHGVRAPHPPPYPLTTRARMPGHCPLRAHRPPARRRAASPSSARPPTSTCARTRRTPPRAPTTAWGWARSAWRSSPTC
jgi:very-long-chain (3R)-3-hydroxyacyl-CoA dehydratase